MKGSGGEDADWRSFGYRSFGYHKEILVSAHEDLCAS